jgi:hypothetical protein
MKRAMSAPGYWPNETSGVLKPAMERYLNGALRDADVPVIRAYLRQWAGASVWDENPHLNANGVKELADLRSRVDAISTGLDIDRWLELALELGMDPL